MKENTSKDIDVYSKDSTVIERPESYNIGVKVGWTAPAKWWNWLFNACTLRLKELFNTTTSIHNEIKNAVGGTLDPESDTQLKDKLEAMKKELADMTAQVQANLTALEATKAQPNGIASLDPDGRIPYSQLPESAMEFKGDWNASTNTPTLADGTGDLGDMYLVSAGGTVDLGSGSITFLDGDRVIYNQAGKWEKISGGSVKSVNEARPDATGNVDVVVDTSHIADRAVTAAKCAGDVVKSVNGRSPTNGNIAIDIPSVSYPISISNGGTGATDAKAAFQNLTVSLPQGKKTEDNELTLFGTGSYWGTYTFITLWDYIKSKILAMTEWITPGMCKSGSNLYMHYITLIAKNSDLRLNLMLMSHNSRVITTVTLLATALYQTAGIYQISATGYYIYSSAGKCGPVFACAGVSAMNKVTFHVLRIQDTPVTSQSYTLSEDELQSITDRLVPVIL